SIARRHARMGRVERALRRLDSVLPVIERAPGWAETYTQIVHDAAETLWLTERTDHVDLIERNLREKVIPIDFRWPMRKSELALARIYALQGRYGEATDWFARARMALDEQGARPERAIVDYDEALMYARRGEPGDPERARPLLDAALAQFRSLPHAGMDPTRRSACGTLRGVEYRLSAQSIGVGRWRRTDHASHGVTRAQQARDDDTQDADGRLVLHGLRGAVPSGP